MDWHDSWSKIQDSKLNLVKKIKIKIARVIATVLRVYNQIVSKYWLLRVWSTILQYHNHI